MKYGKVMIPFLLGELLQAGCQSNEESKDAIKIDNSKEVETEDTTNDEALDDTIDPSIYEDQATKEGGLGDTLPVLENILGPDGENDWNAKIDEVIAFHDKGEGSVHPILETKNNNIQA
ncbi:hypothetical protein M3197_07260 [Sporosarcina aquimarina]|nr:hypothetical protein [Sporosarcina aquimarina]